MAFYAGETVVFKTSAKDVDDAETVITDADVTSVTITIVDRADDSVILNAAAMTWDATDSEWRYNWTTPATAGSFYIKMNIVGPSIDVWEYLKFKTKTNLAGF